MASLLESPLERPLLFEYQEGGVTISTSVLVMRTACSSMVSRGTLQVFIAPPLEVGKLNLAVGLAQRESKLNLKKNGALMKKPNHSSFYNSKTGKVILATMAERREIVAQLRLRQKMSLGEVMRELARQGIINTVTKKPFTKTTIASDFIYLQDQSLERAGVTVDIHRAEVLGELDQVSKVAWSRERVITKKNKDDEIIEDPDLPIVLATIKHRRAVTGTDAPTKISPTDPTGQKEYGADARDALISRLIPELANPSEAGPVGGDDG